MAKQLSPSMQLRRLLLDGVRIIEPYRNVLRTDRSDDPKINAANGSEYQLMSEWVSAARATALKLKRAEMGKHDE